MLKLQNTAKKFQALTEEEIIQIEAMYKYVF